MTAGPISRNLKGRSSGSVDSLGGGVAGGCGPRPCPQAKPAKARLETTEASAVRRIVFRNVSQAKMRAAGLLAGGLTTQVGACAGPGPSARYRDGLPLQVSEGLFDFALRFGRRRRKREPGRAAIVTVEVHGVLQTGNAVLGGDQRRWPADPVLPVHAGRLFSCSVGFPNRNYR